jgi:hypothetical protein
MKTVKAWAGLYRHKIATGWIKDEEYKDTIHAIFKTKKEAQEYCADVVPCQITYELPGSQEKPKRK